MDLDTLLKYISKVMRHFVKILRHFFISHRISLILSGSFLRTMWDIFKVVSFENNEIIIGKMKKKVLRLQEIDFLCGKKHASGNFNLSLVEFSLFPTPDPFPLPFIAPQSGQSTFPRFPHMDTGHNLSVVIVTLKAV